MTKELLKKADGFPLSITERKGFFKVWLDSIGVGFYALVSAGLLSAAWGHDVLWTMVFYMAFMLHIGMVLHYGKILKDHKNCEII